MPRGYITYCFSDWTKDVFSNGVMRIQNGVRTDRPVRHEIPTHWKLGVDYYVKVDPNFTDWTYSRCHKRLRRRMEPGDILFLRTLWREKQYFIGYFVIVRKSGDPNDPVLIADPSRSLFVQEFTDPISTQIVLKLNPGATRKHAAMYHPNIFAQFLGRESLGLDERRTAFLVYHLKHIAREQSGNATSAA